MIWLSFLLTLLSTIKSKNPFPIRIHWFENLLKIPPMVSFITLGPAKPIRAPGSAIFKSPNMANDAVTPPVVGSVKGNIR